MPDKKEYIFHVSTYINLEKANEPMGTMKTFGCLERGVNEGGPHHSRQDIKGKVSKESP